MKQYYAEKEGCSEFTLIKGDAKCDSEILQALSSNRISRYSLPSEEEYVISDGNAEFWSDHATNNCDTTEKFKICQSHIKNHDLPALLARNPRLFVDYPVILADIHDQVSTVEAVPKLIELLKEIHNPGGELEDDIFKKILKDFDEEILTNILDTVLEEDSDDQSGFFKKIVHNIFEVKKLNILFFASPATKSEFPIITGDDLVDLLTKGECDHSDPLAKALLSSMSDQQIINLIPAVELNKAMNNLMYDVGDSRLQGLLDRIYKGMKPDNDNSKAFEKIARVCVESDPPMIDKNL